MDNRSYYIDSIDESNRCVTDQPLCVNCTGMFSFKSDFTGGHEYGRKDYYLFYLYRGRLEVTCEEKQMEMCGGQLIIFSPNTPLIYKNKPGETTDYFWLHFTGSEADALLERVGLSQNELIDILMDERIISAFYSLFDEFIDRDDLFLVSSSAKLINICVLFGRAAAQLDKKNKSLPVLSDSLKYIDEHYREPISIKKLAELEHMSEGHFRLLFRQKTGMPPNYYITTLRLKNACLLLRQTDLSVKEISSATGFDDQLYFSRVFKKHFGMPPKKFR